MFDIKFNFPWRKSPMLKSLPDFNSKLKMNYPSSGKIKFSKK